MEDSGEGVSVTLKIRKASHLARTGDDWNDAPARDFRTLSIAMAPDFTVSAPISLL
jgi:hypothetical protein